VRPNVLQHQYAICVGERGAPLLATKGISICTGWYGWDSKNGICFLCHFDHPWSANSLPNILANLRSYAPKDHKFKSVLVGGKTWWWSRRTRRKIKQFLAQQSELNIVVRDGPFDPFCKDRDLLVSSKTGHLRVTEKLTGRGAPEGLFWFFGPMRRVEINA